MVAEASLCSRTCVNTFAKKASTTCSEVLRRLSWFVVLCTGDELDALFEGAEQRDPKQAGKYGGFAGPRAVLSSFARFMGSLSK